MWISNAEHAGVFLVMANAQPTQVSSNIDHSVQPTQVIISIDNGVQPTQVSINIYNGVQSQITQSSRRHR